MKDNVAPFLKGTNSSMPKCSLKDWLIDFIKRASEIFIFLEYSRALVSTFHSNSCQESNSSVYLVQIAYLRLHVQPENL